MLAALISAILAVMPKFSLRKTTLVEWPQNANTLFFGHYTQVEPDLWIEHMAGILDSDARIYDAILRDLHAQGDYLIRMKYRLLRIAYIMFVSAFVLAGLAQLVREIT